MTEKIVSRVLENFESASREELVEMLREVEREEDDEYEHWQFLVDDRIVEEQHIRFFTSLYEGKIPLEYYIDLINERTEQVGRKVTPKLLRVFPLSGKECRQLLDIIREGDGNFHVQYFLKEELEKSKRVVKPSWVKPFPKTDIPEIGIPISVADAVETIIRNMEELCEISGEIDKNELREQIGSLYSISTCTEKAVLVDGERVDDIPHFREFGPVNTMNISVFSEDDQCRKYGGCRMFLCNDFLECESEEEDVDDCEYTGNWFSGVCSICSRVIPKKYYAVRLPLVGGGWKGCYCSFSCLENDVNDESTALSVGRMKEQLNLIKIRDKNCE